MFKMHLTGHYEICDIRVMHQMIGKRAEAWQSNWVYTRDVRVLAAITTSQQVIRCSRKLYFNSTSTKEGCNIFLEDCFFSLREKRNKVMSESMYGSLLYLSNHVRKRFPASTQIAFVCQRRVSK